MKYAVLTILTWLLSFSIFAQEGAISGRIVDPDNQPLELVNVILKNSGNDQVVKFGITDPNGDFKIEDVPMGSFYLEASMIGFSTYRTSTLTFTDSNNKFTLDDIVLQESVEQLDEITLTAKTPLLEQKTDRLVVNVDSWVTNAGSTALEVLQKSPGISVSKDGNISLKGKSEVLFLIDGRPSYLNSSELANLLGSMSSNELQKIEIMTNPSAKYDASGNAGVINILTKKSTFLGFNGTITTSYGQGAYPKSNNSLMLNYRTEKLNTFLNYGLNYTESYFYLDTERNFYDNPNNLSYTLMQEAKRNNQNLNNNLKLGLDFYPSPNTTIGFSASGFVNPQRSKGRTPGRILDPSGNISSILNTEVNVDNSWKNGGFNLYLQNASEDKRKNFSTNLDYLHYDFSGNQTILGQTFDPGNNLVSENNFKNELPLTIDIFSGRADYALELENGLQLETGIKASRVETKNASDFYVLNGSNYEVDTTRTSAFDYRENISAAYVNMKKTVGKLSLQAGLRLENTNYQGIQSDLTSVQDSTFKRNYTSLFPTIFTGYEVNKDNQITFSAGRRIDRPSYRQLNPFIGYLDKYTYSTGNVLLQPQFSTNFEIGHQYKNKFTTTLNYSVIDGMINETLVQKDSLIVRSVGNIGKRYNYGISESISFEAGNWYTGNLFANLFNNKYDGSINGIPLKVEQWTLALSSNNQFTLANGWTAELSGSYEGRNRNEGQAIILPSGQISVGFSKNLFNDRASLKFNVRDIFYDMNPIEIQNFQNVFSTIHIRRDTRVATVAFTYRFGDAQSSKSRKSEPLEEQKRVNTY